VSETGAGCAGGAAKGDTVGGRRAGGSGAGARERICCRTCGDSVAMTGGATGRSGSGVEGAGSAKELKAEGGRLRTGRPVRESAEAADGVAGTASGAGAAGGEGGETRGAKTTSSASSGVEGRVAAS
jgi:hypothetical protein